MGLLDYFSKGAKKAGDVAKKGKKRKRRKLTYFSGKKNWKKRMEEADDYLEEQHAKKD